MNSHRTVGGSLPLKAFALALGAWVVFDSSAVADDNEYVVNSQGQIVQKPKKGHHDQQGNASAGTLGYGPPGLFPGFQGFGLGYHLGYGYGGDALGVGAEGGYPFYGGPGYPHPEPCLRRFGPITPFPFYAGPGYPTPDHPNFYGGVGALVADQPVVTVATEAGEPIEGIGYGPFTGGVADPEALFAPFTARAAAGAARMEAGPTNPGLTPPNQVPGASAVMPATPSPTIPPPTTPPPGPDGASLPGTGRSLGIDAVPIIDVGGVPAIKVFKVQPGSAAEKAGIQPGDVIHSINGYLTKQSGNVPWILDKIAPSNVLRLSVRTAIDAKVHPITARLQ